MIYEIISTNQFKKDLKRAIRRKNDVTLLEITEVNHMPAKTIKTYRLPVDAIRRASQGERIVFRPKDEPAFAVVPVEDAEYMERLEDELDNRLADEALAEGGENIPLEQVIAEYEEKYGVLD